MYARAHAPGVTQKTRTVRRSLAYGGDGAGAGEIVLRASEIERPI